ncbi:hypothetical protein B0T18DRAFT_205647 [Schizothecium vesticola]|uniref:Uncharacterized protein n=1 Tax=Schizothecium vesticola TaxID=314040 RepID=A0AA40EJ39_9PEZI|nr:hypothetical protein B0T18DRAFT_205647 [Schizothecium vesticola]
MATWDAFMEKLGVRPIEAPTPAPKRRGRPPKNKETAAIEAPAQQRKRGRPPKNKETTAMAAPEPKPKRQRKTPAEAPPCRCCWGGNGLTWSSWHTGSRGHAGGRGHDWPDNKVWPVGQVDQQGGRGRGRRGSGRVNKRRYYVVEMARVYLVCVYILLGI